MTRFILTAFATRTLRAAVAASIAFAAGSTFTRLARADVTLQASENGSLFGHFDQNATDNGQSPANGGTYLITPNNPGVSAMGPAACAATSAMNSFIFLQNQYGLSDLYNRGNAYGSISSLAASLNTTPASANVNSQTGYSGGGVNPDPFVTGKEAYLQSLGPITDATGQQYAIQTVGQVDPAYGSKQNANGPWVGGVDAVIPDAEFIYQQLDEGEDVEMFFAWTDEDGDNPHPGHVVAVTGIDYDETTNSGSISFIDPTNSTGGQTQFGTGDAPEITSMSLEELIDGHLLFGYQGGASGIEEDDNSDAAGYGEIEAIYAESPVPIPEPATALLLALAAPLLLRRRHLSA